jgi:hypothetical protein
MSLPAFEEAMQGFTTEGLTLAESLQKRTSKWSWKIGAALIVPYLDGNDLAQCCQVSRGFYENFLPILWSKPVTILATKKRPCCKFLRP